MDFQTIQTNKKSFESWRDPPIKSTLANKETTDTTNAGPLRVSTPKNNVILGIEFKMFTYIFPVWFVSSLDVPWLKRITEDQEKAETYARDRRSGKYDTN